MCSITVSIDAFGIPLGHLGHEQEYIAICYECSGVEKAGYIPAGSKPNQGSVPALSADGKRKRKNESIVQGFF